MRLQKIEVENFKGVRRREVEFFDILTAIYGENGSGKTTLATAYTWLFANTDAEGNFNPNIRNIEAQDEEVPRVTAYCEDEDGKPYKFSKYQKMKRSGERISLTNYYEVNDVPMPEKDFQKKVTECLGCDSKLFLALTLPDVFLSDMSKKGREAIRSVIFAMSGDITDLEVAQSVTEVDMADVVSLLKFYTKDEIVATQTAVKRKVAEAYGKKGEIIDAKIEGLLASKAHVDEVGLTAELAGINSKIAELTATPDDFADRKAEIAKKQRDVMLRIRDISEQVRKANDKARKALDDAVKKAMLAVSESSFAVQSKTAALARLKETLAQQTEQLEFCRKAYDKLASTEFEGDTTCPTCGQELPKDQIDQMIADFEAKKAHDLQSLEDRGRYTAKTCAGYEAQIRQDEGLLILAKKEEEEAKQALADARQALAELVPLDAEDTTEYKEAKAELDALAEADMALVATGTRETDSEVARLTERSREISRTLGQAENNKRVDALVEKLYADKLTYAQKLADAERILHQINILEMAKNQYCEESVNRHFRIVRWKLFRVLKNGTYEPACIPTVDGKELGSSMNTALEMTAKLDIIRSLQEFYGVKLPIWLDNAEHMDSASLDSVIGWKVGQLIVLKVSDEAFAVHRS